MKHQLLVLAILLLPALRAEPLAAVSGVFAVDRTPPSVPAALEPDDGTTVVSPFLRLRASSTDALSGVAAYEFSLTGIGTGDAERGFAVFRNLPDGTYTWWVRARDAAGNPSAWAGFSCEFVQGDDDDGDGLPDSWELVSFGSLDYSDGTADSNLDGWTDLENAEADRHGYEFLLTLEPGWNMLSLPCDTTEESAAALVAASTGPIWMWNPDTMRYTATVAPPARQGLWVYATEHFGDLPVSGHPPADGYLRLGPGWNLAGTGLPAALDSMDGIRDIMAWIDGGYELHETDGFRFAFLQGYWLYNAIPGPRLLVGE
jgi:hypothetical protein